MKEIKKIIIFAIIVLIAAIIVFAYLVSRPVKNVAEEEAVGGSDTFPTGGETSGKVSSQNKDQENFYSSGKSGSLAKKESVLVRLTENAVAGAAIAGTSTVHYMERSTGHIYKIGLNGAGKTRITNTTILKTFENFWSPKADKMAVRYFDEPSDGSLKLAVKSFLADISSQLKTATATTTATSTELKGVILPPDTMEIAISPFEDKIFYLSSSGGLTSGIVADFKNKNQKKIFEMSFGEFNVSWPIKDTIALLTKPSYAASGYLYFLNQKTGALSRILADTKGLSALASPNGDKVLYSQSGRGGIETFILDLKKETIAEFNIKTFPEKCVWGRKNREAIYCAAPVIISGGNYPDDWYQGLESFDDLIWSKNFSTGEMSLISEKIGADVINPSISEDDSYLIFSDKTDGSIWSLKLK